MTPPVATESTTAASATLARPLRKAMLESLFRLGGADDDRPALTVARSPRSLAPARLAQHHPAGPAREVARSLYQRCLDHYRSDWRPQDASRPVDDVGAAVAAFVAANFTALQGTPMSARVQALLERQLHGVVRLSAGWDTACVRERQAYFEQMALLAVLIAESAAQAVTQGPAAVANVQRAARGYLLQLLGLDPDALTLGDDGLALRGEAH